MSTVVIINAFDPDDFFITRLSEAYEAALRRRNLNMEVLDLHRMNFSHTPFPEQYSFHTLEDDLKKSVEAIARASTVAVFASTRPDKPAPAFKQFVSRLFHLKAGRINAAIWGEINAHDKVLRIITVLDDPALWHAFHQRKNRAVVPVRKVSFGLFGFGQVYSRTFGYLRQNDLESAYAQKCLKAMSDMAEKD